MRIRFPGIQRVDPRGNPDLVEKCRGLIADSGPIPFSTFMDLALYDAEHGYYVNNDGVGRTGDFLTSPEIHPAFGAAIAEQLVELWGVLGQPDPFVVLEPGAGRLRLAEQITSWLKLEALHYIATDLREPDHVPDRVDYRRNVRGVRPHVIVTNELLDAFGVHLFRDARELFVGWDGGFVWVEESPTVAANGKAWVNRRAEEWIHQASHQLERGGFVLTFDYGGSGGLRCFARHGVHHDPFVYVGEQDITCDVDFEALDRVGREHGLATAGYTSQSQFLLRWGFQEIIESLESDTFRSDATTLNLNPLKHLVDPAGLGRIRVMLQAKGVDPQPLHAFDEDARSVELLTPDRYPALVPHNPFAPLL